MKKILSILLALAMMISLCACGSQGYHVDVDIDVTPIGIETDAEAQSESAAAVQKADTVVYGTIYTSNANQDVVEAMAIKDGKYIYVGDKAGAAAYVGDDTEVIDWNDGMIMAGGTEAHGHYMQQSMEKFMVKTKADSLDGLKKDLKKYIESHPDKKAYVGAGWDRQNDLVPKTDIDYAKALDEVCADKPIAIFDDDHHQLVANTKAMQELFPKMGVELVDKKKGQEDKESVKGGIVLRLANGQANGYLRDQAAMYVGNLLFGDALNDEEYGIVMQDWQNSLYEKGYTNTNDAFTNAFGNHLFEQLIKADEEGKIKVCIRPHFCVYVYQMQSDELINEAVSEIEKYHKQSPDNVLPAGIKLFVDGVTESATGLNDVPYVGTDNYGLEILTEDQIYKATKAANEKGIPVHTHSYGNVAIHNTINAFIKAQNEVNTGVRNSMAHVRNVLPEDYKRMAENNIAVAENINWGSSLTEDLVKYNEKTLGIPRKLQIEGYPIKSLVDNGVITGSSTDAPSANDMPIDLFGITQLTVDKTSLAWIAGIPKAKQEAFAAIGMAPDKVLKEDEVLNQAECVPIKDALDIMTIGGAKLMSIEDTRGSIEVGKSADFILVDKNVLECPTTEIHSAKTMKVYYEGELVYERK